MRRTWIALLIAAAPAGAQPAPQMELAERVSTAYQLEDQAVPGLEAKLWSDAFRVCESPIRRSELTRSRVGPFTLELRGRFSCGRLAPAIEARRTGAELIVAGKVTAVSPPEPPKVISEHAPLWQNATVQVAKVARGDRALRTVVIHFPGSTDVAWYGKPVFTVGQEATWLLRRDAEGAWTALDPADVQQPGMVDLFAGR